MGARLARAQLYPPAAPIDRQTPPGRPHRQLWARCLYAGGSRETTSRGVPVPPSPPAPGTLRHSPLPARSSDSCRPAAPPDLGARFSRCLATTSRGLAARLQVARHLAPAPPPAPLQPLSRRAPPEASFGRASVPWHVPGTPRTTSAAAAAPAAAPTPPLPPSDYTPSPACAPAPPSLPPPLPPSILALACRFPLDESSLRCKTAASAACQSAGSCGWWTPAMAGSLRFLGRVQPPEHHAPLYRTLPLVAPSLRTSHRGVGDCARLVSPPPSP